MRTFCGLWCVCLIFCCSFRVVADLPVIKQGSVTVEQSAGTGVVLIGYELTGGPAVVSVDIRTNGVSIGAANLSGVIGDANRLVGVGVHRVMWNPMKDWPGHVASDVTVAVSAWHPLSPPDYLVVNLDDGRSWEVAARYYTEEAQIPGGLSDEAYKTKFLVLRKCPAAGITWQMGRGKGDAPYHNVTLSDDFYIGIYPCTQAQYDFVTGENPSNFKSDSDHELHPVERVSYDMLRGSDEGAKWPSNASAGMSNVDATSFFGILRGRTGLAFDLPTDAQWEFACRGGTTTDLNIGEALSEDALTRCAVCADTQTRAVGTKEPNAWGIYDMHGNVWELCRDWYESLTAAATTDPLGPTSGTARVLRPSGYNVTKTNSSNWYQHGSGMRNQNAPGTADKVIGFRVALPLEGDRPAVTRSEETVTLALLDARTCTACVSDVTSVSAFVSDFDISEGTNVRSDRLGLCLIVR